MKYLRISNKGLLDLRLVFLMGGSTKTEDPTKIGQFGTGLKYAISYLVRTENKFRLFIGKQEVNFSSKDETIGTSNFKEIYCNETSMNITTQYGYQWQAWEALREIWCNAMDEGNESRKSVDSRSQIVGTDDTTTFYIEVTKDIAEVLKNWGNYFFKGDVLFENEDVAIYKNPGQELKLYKNGVLINEAAYYTSLFVYDIKKAQLNELRQYQGFLTSDIGKALLNSNKIVGDILIEAFKDTTKSKTMEVKLDFSYITAKPERLKEIFSGWLFLHPESQSKALSKSVFVSASLYEILRKHGLPTERIKESYGGYYGGVGLGYSSYGKASYREVLNPELQKKIQSIATKYNSSLQYAIAVPKGGQDFEMVVTTGKVIFNSSLENLSDADLEATVLIAVLNTQDASLYKAIKRMIKVVISNRNFKNIFFGRTISNGKKPVYVVPNEEAKAITIDDEDLPF